MIRETTLQAFESIQDRIIPLKMQILNAIKRKNGLTCEEIETMFNIKHQTASARINDLIKERIIIDSTKRRKTMSDRNAIVWVSI